MKIKTLDNWKNKPNTKGLLFFAQVLDELLFDYTLDSYKPMALNAKLLCLEASRTINDVKTGLIKPQNLKHIVDELKWSLNNDLIARLLLGKNLAKFERELNKNISNNLVKLKQVVSLLYHYFDDEKYLNKIKEELIDKIKTGKEKEKIYKLTKTFVTELINYGYNSNHIYFQISSFFFSNISLCSKFLS